MIYYSIVYDGQIIVCALISMLQYNCMHIEILQFGDYERFNEPPICFLITLVNCIYIIDK